MNRKYSETDTFKNHDPDFPVPTRNWEVDNRAKRLREAVRAAGGNAAVSLQSGTPLSSLNNYLMGRDMKAGAILRLAKACGVTLDWLLAGEGPMNSAGFCNRP